MAGQEWREKRGYDAHRLAKGRQGWLLAETQDFRTEGNNEISALLLLLNGCEWRFSEMGDRFFAYSQDYLKANKQPQVQNEFIDADSDILFRIFNSSDMSPNLCARLERRRILFAEYRCMSGA